MPRSDSPFLRTLIALCILAQLAMVSVRGADRVLCFATAAVCDGREHDACRDHEGHEHGHHEGRTTAALPHDHEGGCCVDVRVPNDASRPDHSMHLPALPPPQLIAIIELPLVTELSVAPPAPPVESRGIPPATGLRVTRILV